MSQGSYVGSLEMNFFPTVFLFPLCATRSSDLRNPKRRLSKGAARQRSSACCEMLMAQLFPTNGFLTVSGPACQEYVEIPL